MLEELKSLVQRKIILMDSLMKLFEREPIRSEYANTINEAYSFYVDFLKIVTEQGYASAHQLRELDHISDAEFDAVSAIARERGLI